jgi:hypothetical protein
MDSEDEASKSAELDMGNKKESVKIKRVLVILVSSKHGMGSCQAARFVR